MVALNNVVEEAKPWHTRVGKRVIDCDRKTFYTIAQPFGAYFFQRDVWYGIGFTERDSKRKITHTSNKCYCDEYIVRSLQIATAEIAQNKLKINNFVNDFFCCCCCWCLLPAARWLNVYERMNAWMKSCFGVSISGEIESIHVWIFYTKIKNHAKVNRKKI